MSRRVLGGVDDETEGGGGEPLAADFTGSEESGFGYGLEIGNGGVDTGLESLHQRGEIRPVVVYGALGGQSGELFGAETLASRVGQQPLQAPGQVGQMEPDRRGAAGPSPELRRGEALHDREHVFADLKDGVRGGLKQWLDAGDGAAEPDFDWYCHLTAFDVDWLCKLSESRLRANHSKGEPRRHGDHGGCTEQTESQKRRGMEKLLKLKKDDGLKLPGSRLAQERVWDSSSMPPMQ